MLLVTLCHGQLQLALQASMVCSEEGDVILAGRFPLQKRSQTFLCLLCNNQLCTSFPQGLLHHAVPACQQGGVTLLEFRVVGSLRRCDNFGRCDKYTVGSVRPFLPRCIVEIAHACAVEIAQMQSMQRAIARSMVRWRFYGRL